jgi:serine/threonine protein kinase
MTTFGILANSSSLIQLEQYDDYASEISGRVQFFNRNELRKISHLGNGCFSNVDCVVTKSRDHFALKHLDPTRISRSDEFVIAASDLAREAKILSKLEHSNVIRLRGVSDSTLSQSWEDEHGYFLLMDVLHGTLKDRLQGWRKGKKKSFLSFAKRGSRAQIDEMMGRFETVALGIVKGMAYIHSQNIIIQDLKPANIGFGEDGEVRLFDFGMAREMDCEMNANDLMCGTPRYVLMEFNVDRKSSV